MRKKRGRFSCLLLSFLIVINLTACTRSGSIQKQSDADPAGIKILAFGTGDSGGTMYPVGEAIEKIICAGMKNIQINLTASGGSAGNVADLRSGQLDIALVTGDIAYCAYYGKEEYKDQAMPGLRAAAAIYISSSNWLALREDRYEYVHDLAGQNIVAGPKNSATDRAALMALKMTGTKTAETLYGGLRSGGEMLLSGQAKAVHGFAGIPIPGTLDICQEKPCTLLKYTNEELTRIIEAHPYYQEVTIPAGTYPDQKEDVETFGVKCLICVREDMDEETVYSITKILCESVQQLKEGHAALAAMEEPGFVCDSIPIPLHEGAERYYRENAMHRQQ